VSISNNTAKSGAAIYGNGSTVRMEDRVQFINNSAADSGGALYVSQGTSVNILGGMVGSSVGVQLTSNYAGSYGGAVFVVGERSRISATSMVVFEGNSALLTGGAIVAGGSTSVTLRAETANERSVIPLCVRIYIYIYIHICIHTYTHKGRERDA
jgi:predicted outer membrane repeat protein